MPCSLDNFSSPGPFGEGMRGRSLPRVPASLGRFETVPADFTPFLSEASTYVGVQDVPIGLCTARPAFGNRRAESKEAGVQGVPLSP